MTTSSIDSNDKSINAEPNSLRATVLVVLLLCALQLANLFYRIDSLPAEVSLRIECAKLILSGQIPYVDFFVLDAPLSLFITTLPVKLAQLLHLDTGYQVAYCTLVFEWAVSLLSQALTTALFLNRKPLGHSLWCQSFLLTFAVLNIACVFQFGQIEHFLMLGMTPYLVARWLEYRAEKLELWETLLSGMAAGFAILLDPYFWVVPVAVELTLALHFKRFPTRIVTALTILAATAFSLHAAIYQFGSVMMKGYQSHILPLLIADRQTFDIYMFGTMSCPDSRIVYYFLVFVTLMAFGIKKHSSIVTPLIVIGWMGMAYHIALCKGFFFQALPMFWCSSLAIAVIGTSLLFDLKRLCSEQFAKYIRPFPIVFALIFATVGGSLLVEQHLQKLAETAAERYSSPSQRQITDVFTIISTKSRQLDKIIVLSDNVSPFYPTATLKQRLHGSRIMWSFHLPILAKMKKRPDCDPKEYERLAQFYKKILREDIKNNRPVLIFSDQTEAAELLVKSDLEKLIRSHYGRNQEAQFFSDNLPPREFDNPNYPLWVDSYEI